MPETYTATVDRIVDGRTAVLLLEADGEVFEQFDIPVERLPADCEEGSVVSVTVEDETIITIELQPEETAERSERIREKLDRLSKRLGDDS